MRNTKGKNCVHHCVCSNMMCIVREQEAKRMEAKLAKDYRHRSHHLTYPALVGHPRVS